MCLFELASDLPVGMVADNCLLDMHSVVKKKTIFIKHCKCKIWTAHMFELASDLPFSMVADHSRSTKYGLLTQQQEM